MITLRCCPLSALRRCSCCRFFLLFNPNTGLSDWYLGFQWAARVTLTAHRSFYTILLTGAVFMQISLSKKSRKNAPQAVPPALHGLREHKPPLPAPQE